MVGDNEYMSSRLILSCTNVAETETTGKYSFKTKCEWETKVRGQPPATRSQLAAEMSNEQIDL
jgi:hypothetical protein